MLKSLKVKVLKYIKGFLEEEEYINYSPKKSRDLKAVSFTQKIAGEKYQENLYQCTEWDNGEGYDICINTPKNEKFLSLSLDDIEGIISCLNYMNYFNIDE